MNRILKKIIIVTALFITILITYALFAYFSATRSVELNDQDIIYHPQKVADSNNGYIVLLPALRQIKQQNLISKNESLLKDENKVDANTASTLVKKYSSFLIIWSASLKTASFQVPQIQYYNEGAKTEKFTMEMLFLYKLAFLNIKALLHEGNFGDAELEIEKLLRYGHRIQNSDGMLIYEILGSMVKDRALNLIQEWTFASNFDSAYYKNLIPVIEKYSDNSGIAKGLRIEYTGSASLFKQFMEETIKNDPEHKALYEEYKRNPDKMRFLYNENATLNVAANYYRQTIKNLNGPYINAKRVDVERWSGGFSFFYQLFSGNLIGKMLLQVMPNFNIFVDSAFELEVKFRLTELLLAQKAYYADKGSMPSSLEELVPNYIESIPKDPFNNTALRYSKTNKMIYSSAFDINNDKKKKLSIKLSF